MLGATCPVGEASMFRNMCGQRVAQMLHVLSLEGITVDDGDISMLCSYMKGTVSGRDLLAHVYQFATLSSYQDWLSTTSRMHGGNSSPTVEQIVAEVERFIRRKHLEFPHDSNSR
jgi:hypothetical protein